MREKLIKFARGRYGNDRLNQHLLTMSIVLLVVNIFIKNQYLQIFSTAIALFVVFRTLSKNRAARYQENQRYLKFIRNLKRNTIDRIKYKFFECPNCNQSLRVPRGKGEITITCPNCKLKFDRKS